MLNIRKNIFGLLLAGFALGACSLSFGMNIFQAIESNDKNKVEELFKGKSEDEKRKLVNLVNEDDRTPLDQACENNNLEIVELLIPYCTKETINKVNAYTRWTPFFWACCNNNLKIVKLLLKKEAYVDLDIINEAEKNKIDIKENSEEILKLLEEKFDEQLELLKTKGKLYCQNDEGETLIWKAFRTNNLRVLNKLLKYVFNELDKFKVKEFINKAYNRGETLLFLACMNNNLEIVKLLLPYCTEETINKANKNCWTPLLTACCCIEVNLEIIELLLKFGAIVSNNEITAANIKKHKKIIEMLELTQKFDNCVKSGQYFEYKSNNEDLLKFVEDLKASKRYEILKKKDPIIMMDLRGNRKSKLFDVKIKINN